MAGNGNAVEWFIDRHVRDGRGERFAMADAARTLTYAGLQTATARFAGALARAVIAREHRIALLLLDSIDFPIAFWGCLRAGVVPIPINMLLPHDQVGYILADARAEALIVSSPVLPPLLPTLRALHGLKLVVVSAPDGSSPALADPSHVRFADFLERGDPATEAVTAPPDEVAFWLYSSGSTGAPKGVRHVHGSLRATAETYGEKVLGITADDLVFSASKMFHAYGLGMSMTFPMSIGASAVVLPDRPTPDAVLAMLSRFRPTIFATVPTLYAAMLARPDLGPGAGSDRLRLCISAGEALPEHVGRAWRERVGVEVLDGIGSTEMLHIFISNRPGEVRYGTTGVPVPGYQAKIVDENSIEVADGESGELLVRGPTAADGYWNQRAKSRRTFVGEWTRTGDVYVREPAGYLRYHGRIDDMIKVGGVWVSPFEVEEALASHPAVLEAAVEGHRDADGLIKPKAFVVLQDGAGHIEAGTLYDLLKEHVKERIGAWKYPRWIEVVPALPKTGTGKIERYKLRAA
jgi:4-hydroxybenzoate-CoA ligase